jgi:hypothetical protein
MHHGRPFIIDKARLPGLPKLVVDLGNTSRWGPHCRLIGNRNRLPHPNCGASGVASLAREKQDLAPR